MATIPTTPTPRRPTASVDDWRPAVLALADRLISQAAPVSFRLATTEVEREATYRLRAQTVVSRGWKTATELGGDQERDMYDDHALHLVGCEGGRVIATGRLVLPEPGRRLPTEAEHDLVIEPRGQVVNFDRIIVDPAVHDRGHRLSLALLAAAARETLNLGYDHWAGIDSRPMIRLWRLMHFSVQVLGPSRIYWGEERFPVRFDLRHALSLPDSVTARRLDPAGP